MQGQNSQAVKGFALPKETREDEINRLQQRFNGKLTVVQEPTGVPYVYAEDRSIARTLEIFARFASLPEVKH